MPVNGIVGPNGAWVMPITEEPWTHLVIRTGFDGEPVQMVTVAGIVTADVEGVA